MLAMALAMAHRAIGEGRLMTVILTVGYSACAHFTSGRRVLIGVLLRLILNIQTSLLGSYMRKSACSAGRINIGFR